jgi:hypothetical protein
MAAPPDLERGAYAASAASTRLSPDPRAVTVHHAVFAPGEVSVRAAAAGLCPLTVRHALLIPGAATVHHAVFALMPATVHQAVFELMPATVHQAVFELMPATVHQAVFAPGAATVHHAVLVLAPATVHHAHGSRVDAMASAMTNSASYSARMRSPARTWSCGDAFSPMPT